MHTHDQSYPPSTKRFYIAFLVAAGIWIVGGYNDMWAHAHIPELESFFTPWHAIFYSGFLLMCIVFFVTALRNHRQGYPWRFSLPKDYHFSALGLVIFLIGGVGDMIWHTLLGVEKNFAIIISPPHMLISIGGMLTTIGFLRSIWINGKTPEHTTNRMIAVIVLYITLSFNYMLDYFNPFVFPYMMKSFTDSKLFVAQLGDIMITPQLSEILGAACIIMFTTFIMGILLMSIRFWKPPFGTFTMIFTLNVTAVILAYTRHFWFILTAFIIGLIVDCIYRFVVENHIKRHIGLRIFGFFVPFTIFTLMAITIVLTDASLWALPMWGGTILLASFLGYLMTHVLIPPSISHSVTPKPAV